MDYETARIGLVRGRHDLKVLPQAIGDQRQIRRIAHSIVESLPAGQRFCRAVKTLLRKQRRPQPIARRVSHADAFCRHAQALAQAGRLCGRDAERGYQRAFTQTKQLAGGSRRAEHAASRGDVPALVVVLRRDRKPDACLDLVADHQGEQSVFPAHLPELRKREQRRRDRRGRMDHGAQMGVAEIVDIGGRGVEKGRAQRIDSLVAANYRGLFSAGKLSQ